MQPISIEALARIVGAAITRASTPAGPAARTSQVTSVSTDSRTTRAGDCFFAIAGEQFDGHDYVAQALAKGAACAVVSRTVDGLGAAARPILRVADTIKALGDLAREYRRMNPFKVVAITGSVGKTTTRQIIFHVLSQHLRARQARANFNNAIGLPLTLLVAEPQDEVIVAELGANHPGEIAYLTRIARPDVAVVTNVYPAHLEGFGDLAAIVREKVSIAEALADEGALIVNADSDALVAACRDLENPFHTFGRSAGARYRAEHVTHEGLRSTFTIRDKRVCLPLPGPGNVENALAAWAVCDRLGLTVDDFAAAIESLPAVAMRAELLQIGSLTVLNDCYNANPASMRNALAILHQLSSSGDSPRKRRSVFICGGMAELGPQTPWLHAELGAAVAEAGVELLVTVGQAARNTARVAKEVARHDLQTICFDDTLAVCDRLGEWVRRDDIILVKGSRTARLERVVEKLRERFTDAAVGRRIEETPAANGRR